ncbi:HEPN domain-containing protein [Geodermatophilus telluris]|uniref:ApeA N-terminal domain 1-containing protein n=1 Tax=Geodermatophilus telluris TaxID=1190417 RepID=UPI001114453B|nr:HEPN domain-containing protein [Geodermatophilus telluris]
MIYPNGDRQAGQLELEPSKSPHGEVFGTPPGLEKATSFPQPPQHFSVLACDLRVGYQPLLLNASVEMWFPGRSLVRAEAAVVGHGLEQDPESTFPEVSLQITGGHRIFGATPVKETSGPRSLPPQGTVEYKATIDVDANRSYQRDDVELRCRYWLSAHNLDYYRFGVRTAPVFEIRDASRPTALGWIADHVLPLRELVTLGTLEQQTVSWLELDHEDDGTKFGSVQVFSREIAQSPYAPTIDRDKDGRSLFVFSALPYSPLELVERWEKLRAAHPNFIEPLIRGVTEPTDSRSGFLLTVQALEGLHTETYGEGSQYSAKHKEERDSILKDVKQLGLSKKRRAFLHRWLDMNGRYSLRDRLKELRDDVADDVLSIVNLDLIPGDVPLYRNQISHGAGNVPATTLRPVGRALAALGVAHVLRLLDLPRDRMSHLFTR